MRPFPPQGLPVPSASGSPLNPYALSALAGTQSPVTYPTPPAPSFIAQQSKDYSLAETYEMKPTLIDATIQPPKDGVMWPDTTASPVSAFLDETFLLMSFF